MADSKGIIGQGDLRMKEKKANSSSRVRRPRRDRIVHLIRISYPVMILGLGILFGRCVEISFDQWPPKVTLRASQGQPAMALQHTTVQEMVPKSSFDQLQNNYDSLSKECLVS